MSLEGWPLWGAGSVSEKNSSGQRGASVAVLDINEEVELRILLLKVRGM